MLAYARVRPRAVDGAPWHRAGAEKRRARRQRVHRLVHGHAGDDTWLEELGSHLLVACAQLATQGLTEFVLVGFMIVWVILLA